MIKTTAVIKNKTTLFGYYFLYNFTNVRHFLINLSLWLFMKRSCYSCGFYGQLPLVCVGTLTPTCHLPSLQNKRRKQACYVRRYIQSVPSGAGQPSIFLGRQRASAWLTLSSKQKGQLFKNKVPRAN